MPDPAPLVAWNPKAGATELVTHDELERRGAAGQLQLVKGQTYPMATGDVARGGDVRDVPDHLVAEFRAHGYRFASPQEAARAESRNNPMAPYRAFASNAVDGALLNAGHAALVKAGVMNPDTIAADAAEHPLASGVGNVTGAVVGTAALGEFAPALLAERALGGAGTLAGRVALDAAGGAVEGTVRGFGGALDESALGRTDVTAESLAVHGGMGFLMGTAVGATIGGLRALRARGSDARAVLKGAGVPEGESTSYGPNGPAEYDYQPRLEPLRKEKHQGVEGRPMGLQTLLDIPHVREPYQAPAPRANMGWRTVERIEAGWPEAAAAPPKDISAPPAGEPAAGGFRVRFEGPRVGDPNGLGGQFNQADIDRMAAAAGRQPEAATVADAVNPHATTVEAPTPAKPLGDAAAKGLVDDMAAKAVARRAALGGIMGGVLGNMVGHPVLGAEVGAMLGGAARPGGQLMRAAQAIAAVRTYVDAGIEHFMEGRAGQFAAASARAMPRMVAPATVALLESRDVGERANAYRVRSAELARMATDPNILADRLTAAGVGIHEHLPDATAMVGARAASAIQALVAAAPRPLTQSNPLMPLAQGPVPDSEVRRFTEIDTALQDPLRIVDQLAAGRIPDPAAVAAVKATYPAYWNMVESSFANRLAGLKGGLKQRARMQASITFGLTAHPALSPQAIATSQAVAVGAGASASVGPRGARAKAGRSAPRGSLARDAAEMSAASGTKLDRLLLK